MTIDDITFEAKVKMMQVRSCYTKHGKEHAILSPWSIQSIRDPLTWRPISVSMFPNSPGLIREVIPTDVRDLVAVILRRSHYHTNHFMG